MGYTSFISTKREAASFANSRKVFVLSDMVLYNTSKRCFAALNDAPKARFIRKINRKIAKGELDPNSYMIDVELHVLATEFKFAAAKLLEHVLPLLNSATYFFRT